MSLSSTGESLKYPIRNAISRKTTGSQDEAGRYAEGKSAKYSNTNKFPPRENMRRIEPTTDSWLARQIDGGSCPPKSRRGLGECSRQSEALEILWRPPMAALWIELEKNMISGYVLNGYSNGLGAMKLIALHRWTPMLLYGIKYRVAGQPPGKEVRLRQIKCGSLKWQAVNRTRSATASPPLSSHGVAPDFERQ